jgi:hypothetical protein
MEAFLKKSENLRISSSRKPSSFSRSTRNMKNTVLLIGIEHNFLFDPKQLQLTLAHKMGEKFFNSQERLK